jgi:hypothetical protein
MEPLHASPKKLFSFGCLSVAVVIAHVICLFLPYWMHVSNDLTIGIFHTIHDGDDKIIETGCNDNMGELECGYVKSFQIASVISVIFGGLTTILYFLSPNYLNDLIAFFAVTGTLFQSVFGLMTFVLFYYFKVNYFDDDGVNQEYPSVDEDNVQMLVGWYLWIAFNGVSWFMTGFGYYSLYLSGYQKKGLLTL